MYEAYKCKKWGFVPDFARLDIIYEQGGIYLDTDVELLQSFDNLLNYEFFCGFESKEYVALGLGFGALPKNRDIYNMMRLYDDLNFKLDNGDINLTASPIYQTEYFIEQGLLQNGKLQIINGGVVLPTEYLCPMDVIGYGELTNNSISIHHYAGTWLDEKIQREKFKKKKNKDMLLHRLNCQ